MPDSAFLCAAGRTPPAATAIASSAATSEITVNRWVRPAGIAPGSRPSNLTPYGRSTSTRETTATALSSRTSRAPVARQTSSPASGTLTKAANAAYLWMPPDIDSEMPGRSVGKPATRSRHPLHTPTSPATRRSSRASPTASTAEPAASSASDMGSSQPCGVKTYSLIMWWSGSRPDNRCRASIPATPQPMTTNPNNIPMALHDGHGDAGGPSEIHPRRP
nr:hypothetical protein [Microbispora oryzae]